MRTRGWQGDLPQDEDEARARVLAAARLCVERFGPVKTTLSDVAGELGVTRQTVYRYFGSTADMLAAVAQSGVEDFLDRMELALAGVSTPADAVIEGLLFALEAIPGEPRIGLLLRAGETDFFSQGVSSSQATQLAHQMLRRMPVDWEESGIDDRALDQLAELVLRLFLSFIQYPFDKVRDTGGLREYLSRWIAPALTRSADFMAT